MKGKRILISLCFVLGVTSLLTVSCYAVKTNGYEIKEGIKEDKNIYKFKTENELNNEVYKFIKKLDVDMGKLISRDSMENKDISEFNFENGEVKVNRYTGEVYFIEVNNLNETISNYEFNENDLKEKAKSYYNILLGKKDYEMKKDTLLDNSLEAFYWELQINDKLSSKENSIEMVLNRRSGKIKRATISTGEITNDLSEMNVSKEKAEKIIKEFILVNQYKYSGNIYMDVVKYNGMKEKDFHRNNLRIAWVGEIIDNNGNKGIINIDITDGIIIGGDWKQKNK